MYSVIYVQLLMLLCHYRATISNNTAIIVSVSHIINSIVITWFQKVTSANCIQIVALYGRILYVYNLWTHNEIFWWYVNNEYCSCIIKRKNVSLKLILVKHCIFIIIFRQLHLYPKSSISSAQVFFFTQ